MSLKWNNGWLTELWPGGWLWLLAAALGLLITVLPVPVAAALLIIPPLLFLIYQYPLVGLGLALLAGPFGAVERLTYGPLLLDSGQGLLLLTLGMWLLKGLGRGRVVIPYTSLNLPLLIFIGIAALASLNALSAAYTWRELLKWMEVLLITWLIVTEFPPSPNRKLANPQTSLLILIILILLPALLQAAIGIWQFGLRGDGPVHFLILGRFYRAFGTFQQPNPFGGYMALNAALALGVLLGWGIHWASGTKLETQTSKLETILWLVFVAAAAAATGLALVMSWSRGAWLGFAAALGALIFFLPRRRWQGVMLVGAAAFGLWLALQLNLLPDAIAGRLTGWQADFQLGDVRGVDINDNNYAVLERLAHWQAALDMARDHLWWGVGFGNYEPAYPDYQLINWPYPLGHAHNYYLNLLAEIGVIGLIAYLFLWGNIFWQTIMLLKLADWRWRGVALGLLACWTTLSVHHFLDKLYVNNIYIHLGALSGLLILLKRQRSTL
ncbi:MAG: O-antigen ligase family protein [Anaerolineae bacterium]|nr:O-antigen ligase family protein [Anaerolineae bacterium]